MATIGRQDDDLPDRSSLKTATDTLRAIGRNLPWTRIYKFPWWALILLTFGIWVAITMASDTTYTGIVNQLKNGIAITLKVSFFSYLLALVVGLTVGIIRSSPPVPKHGFVRGTFSLIKLAVYNISSIFVEVMRGLPILVVLLVFAFVVIPEVKRWALEQFNIRITFRGQSAETAIIVLGLTYGAYLSEIFRAGIQSIDKGQVEAARSLGMTYIQTMRLVILPQAIRRVLPPLGNDFISMIKDSSLVSVIAVRDVTQIAKTTSGSNFLVLQTYLAVAVLYLTMTVLGSVLVQLLERSLKQDTR